MDILHKRYWTVTLHKQFKEIFNRKAETIIIPSSDFGEKILQTRRCLMLQITSEDEELVLKHLCQIFQQKQIFFRHTLGVIEGNFPQNSNC